MADVLRGHLYGSMCWRTGIWLIVNMMREAQVAHVVAHLRGPRVPNCAARTPWGNIRQLLSSIQVSFENISVLLLNPVRIGCGFWKCLTSSGLRREVTQQSPGSGHPLHPQGNTFHILISAACSQSWASLYIIFRGVLNFLSRPSVLYIVCQFWLRKFV